MVLPLTNKSFYVFTNVDYNVNCNMVQDTTALQTICVKANSTGFLAMRTCYFHLLKCKVINVVYTSLSRDDTLHIFGFSTAVCKKNN